MTRRFPPDVPFLALWVVLAVAGTVAGAAYVDIAWYVLAFASINLATFVLYGLDKLLASFETRRIPERTLQLTAFLFGSPGALIAMWLFRHKTRKTSFQLVLALLVLVQALALTYVLWRAGLINLS